MVPTSGSEAVIGRNRGRVIVVRGVNPTGGTLNAGARTELTTETSLAVNQTVNAIRAPEIVVPGPSVRIGQVMNRGT